MVRFAEIPRPLEPPAPEPPSSHIHEISIEDALARACFLIDVL